MHNSLFCDYTTVHSIPYGIRNSAVQPTTSAGKTLTLRQSRGLHPTGNGLKYWKLGGDGNQGPEKNWAFKKAQTTGFWGFYWILGFIGCLDFFI